VTPLRPEERACPRCERINLGRDFCVDCGEYLRWEPTMFIPTIDPGPVTTVARPPAALRAALVPHVAMASRPAAQAAIDLSAPGRVDGDGTPHVDAPPGGTVVMSALVRNESDIVDNYDIRVAGIPDEWWTATPATTYLVPFGTGVGRSEQDVQVALHPPREPEAQAREWPIQVIARSRARNLDVATAPAVMLVRPYADLDSTLRPAKRSGRRRADYTLRVHNRANAATNVMLDGVDPESALAVSFFTVGTAEQAAQRRGIPAGGAGADVAIASRLGSGSVTPEYMARMALFSAVSRAGRQGRRRPKRRRSNLQPIAGLEIAPGERAQVVVRATPVRQTIVGRTRVRPFQVMTEPVRAPGTTGEAPVVAAVFRQRAWIPWWLMLLLPLAVAALVIFLLTRPDYTTVPNLTSATSTLAAESALRRADLVLGNTESVPNDTVRAGSVIGQSPGPGTRVEADTTVTIQIAVSSGKVKVPKIVGLTTAQASTVLTQQGLQLGPALAPPANVATSRITSQAPIEGTLAPQGSPVSPVFGSTTPPTSRPAPRPSGGGGGSGGGASPRVPDVLGAPQADAAKQVANAGYVPQIDGVFSDTVDPGTIVRQTPAGNAELKAGGRVQLVVSKGIPEVLFTNNLDIVGIGGARGRPRRAIAATAEAEVHPVTSADGLRLAYRRGPIGNPNPLIGPGQIWIASTADPLSAQPLTDPGHDDRRPAFSPNGATLAFISDRVVPGDPDLCFIALAAAGSPVSCIADPATKATRPTWSPDGTTILVTANDPVGQVELLRYTSQTPESANAAAWTSAGFVTDGLHGAENAGEQVTMAAFSPNGKRLAVAANWGDGIFRVWLVPVSGSVIGSKATRLPRVRACELAWRPDSAELVVAWRDNSCDGTGQVIRVDVKNPDTVRLLTQVGQNSGDPVFGSVPAT
jgi:beta-lactam-binding protein with PASTA domain